MVIITHRLNFGIPWCGPFINVSSGKFAVLEWMKYAKQQLAINLSCTVSLVVSIRVTCTYTSTIVKMPIVFDSDTTK